MFRFLRRKLKKKVLSGKTAKTFVETTGGDQADFVGIINGIATFIRDV